MTKRLRCSIITEDKKAEHTPFSPSDASCPVHRSDRFVGLFSCGDMFPARFLLFKRGCIVISAKELYINDDIRAREVRMLDENNGQLGIMSLNDAKTYAYDRGLDLVLIAPTATPPVCRAMDYGKYRYEQDKKEKEAKKKQQIVEIKEVQLSCRIDDHDFETKVGHATRFLKEGNKVRVELRFKGREIVHQELGLEVLNRFAAACSEYGAVDKKPVLEGKQLTMFIAPSGSDKQSAK